MICEELRQLQEEHGGVETLHPDLGQDGIPVQLRCAPSWSIWCCSDKEENLLAAAPEDTLHLYPEPKHVFSP